MSTHRAQAVWEGDLESGIGRVDLESGVAPTLQVSWRQRTGDGVAGQTSPEELIAAAHGSCFAMALSLGLSEAGHTPQRLSVAASATIEATQGGFAIKRFRGAAAAMGWMSGIDADAFQEQARSAAENCPVSGALRGNVDISVEAELVQE